MVQRAIVYKWPDWFNTREKGVQKKNKNHNISSYLINWQHRVKRVDFIAVVMEATIIIIN